MAIDPLTAVTPNDGSSYPDNAAINATSPSATDGTPLTAIGMNNYWHGRQQALLNYAGLTPTGVVESDTVSQELEAFQKGFGVGVGKFVRWFLKDDPSVTGDRVLLLSGQGVLRASYPLLDAAIYVGDPDNPTALDRYHADDAGGVTRNIAGNYLILPESRDYVLPNGPRITESAWNTQIDYGATNNKIQLYSVEDIPSDDVVVTVKNLTGPSADDGFSVEANMLCYLEVFSNFNAGVGSAQGGISKNSNQLTTTIAAITPSHRKGIGATPAVDRVANIAWAGKMEIGDIARPHTDGSVISGGTATKGSIHIIATELPRENTDTIMGITY